MNAMMVVALFGIAVLAAFVCRSLLFPPVVFAAVWAGAFVIIAVSGDALFPVSDATRLVYLAGAVAFAFGGVAAWSVLARLPGRACGPRPVLVESRVARVVDATVIVLIIGLPFYWQQLQQAMRLTAATTLLQAARIRDLQAQEGLVPQVPHLLANLVQMSIVLTLVAFSAAGRGRAWQSRLVTLFSLSLLYQILTGARAGAALLVFGVVGVVWARSGRVRLARVLPALVAFVLVFELIAIQLEKGFVRRGVSLQQNLPALLGDARGYLVGGVVAFDRLVEHPGEIPSTGGLARTAKQIANQLGAAEYDLPGQHAQFSTFGDFVETNVYTAYFLYYPDFGFWGTIFLVALLGVVCTVAYWAALRQSPAGLVLYGIAFVGMLQSVFADGFYSNVNLLGKTCILLCLLYATCRAVPEGRREVQA